MQVKAEAKNLRTSPRKLRLVADLVRPLSPDKALLVLKQTRKRAAATLAKVIKQALANATNNFKLAKSELKFKTVEVNGGPVYKRWQAVSKGRAHGVKKRTAHIKIILEAKETAPAAAEKTAKSASAKATAR